MTKQEEMVCEHCPIPIELVHGIWTHKITQPGPLTFDHWATPRTQPTQGGLRMHRLKTWPQFFDAIADGSKRFELRKNDRDFRVGDVLRLQEWNPNNERFTGREMDVEVTYKAQGIFGLAGDLCVMSIARLEGTRP